MELQKNTSGSKNILSRLAGLLFPPLIRFLAALNLLPEVPESLTAAVRKTKLNDFKRAEDVHLGGSSTETPF